VFGYVNAGNLNDPNVGYTTWQWQDLTTVAYFGVHVNNDGSLNSADVSSWGSNAGTLVSTAHSHGVKVVLSIVQQTQSTLCQSLGAAQTTVDATIANLDGADGVNIDYEGSQADCTSSSDTMASRLDNLAKLFRQDLPPAQSNLTIATYASAAAFPGGFFDIPGLAHYVDQFFVMAYDMDGNYSGGNWQAAPLNCASYCFSPTAPLTTYSWNDTRAAQTYLNVVPASQVILGVPYYGYTACVASLSSPRPGPNAVAWPSSTAHWSAPTYLDSTTTNGYSGVSNWSESRDANDAAGAEPYSTWQSSTYSCWRESYWDDATSLSNKYALVNSDQLAGVGLFALDYGGGSSELWGALSQSFACPTAADVSSAPNGTGWMSVPGSAHDIAGTASCSAWALGSNSSAGGYGIWHWSAGAWTQFSGAAVRIAADASGNPWVVNSGGAIYQWTGSAWQHLPGAATDIAVASDGTAWVIGTNAVPGGYGIWQYSGGAWTAVPGGGVRIAAGPNGDAWVVNSAGAIYQFVAGQWVREPGSATDIGAGGGAVWMTGNGAVPGGQQVNRWNGSGWTAVGGGGLTLAVDPLGLPWVINASGAIYERI
jgi:spore germination protein YaaH